MAVTLDTVIASVLGGIGTGIVGVIGLVLKQRYTENTRQISATLAELEQLTEKCSRHASAAWLAPGDPQSCDISETVCLLHEIGVLVGFVSIRVQNSNMRLRPALLNFRNAASGDNFDVKGRPANRERMYEIRAAAASLKIACREVDFERRWLPLPL